MNAFSLMIHLDFSGACTVQIERAHTGNQDLQQSRAPLSERLHSAHAIRLNSFRCTKHQKHSGVMQSFEFLTKLYHMSLALGVSLKLL